MHCGFILMVCIFFFPHELQPRRHQTDLDQIKIKHHRKSVTFNGVCVFLCVPARKGWFEKSEAGGRGGGVFLTEALIRLHSSEI